ncbi:MAG: hypothetical protein LUC88_08740 [Prevotella sp.]|nr:hypothetical protein [Prevotella sp.]
MPFVKIPWDKYEVALLIDSYNRVTSGELSRRDAVSMLSKRLRNGKKLNGVEVSDKYRNENGIQMQMAAIEYCLTNRARGFKSPSKLFKEIAQLYMENQDSFSTLLVEANSIYPENLNYSYIEPKVDTKSYLSEQNIEHPNLLANIKNVLFKHFEKGFRLESFIDCKRFRKYYIEDIGKEFENSDEKLYDIIRTFCIEFEKKAYVPETMLSDDVRNSISGFIFETFNSGKTYLFYDFLFKKFLDELLESKIVNQMMLHSYLQHFYWEKWFFTARYIATNGNVSVNIDNEVVDFVGEQGKPVLEDDVVKALYWLPEMDVRKAFNANTSILIHSGKNARFHIHLFVISEKELNKISQIIDNLLAKYEFISSDELISAIKTSVPNVLNNNSCISPLGIRKALSVYLADKFSFNSALICKLGQNIKPKDTILNYAKTHETFTLAEINNVVKSANTVLNFHLASILKYSIRIDENHFCAKQDVDFDIKGIDGVIEKFFYGNKDFIPLRQIKNFSVFPENKFPWNGRLLESFLLTRSNSFSLLYAEFLNINNICGAVVKKSKCIDMSFDEVIAKALAESKTELTDTECLNFLVDEGYIVQKKYKRIDSVIAMAESFRRNNINP